jgi:hypothetical protein
MQARAGEGALTGSSPKRWGHDWRITPTLEPTLAHVRIQHAKYDTLKAAGTHCIPQPAHSTR